MNKELEKVINEGKDIFQQNAERKEKCIKKWIDNNLFLKIKEAISLGEKAVLFGSEIGYFGKNKEYFKMAINYVNNIDGLKAKLNIDQECGGYYISVKWN